MTGHQLAYHHGDQSEDAKRRPHANLSAAEPVLGLALVEHNLQHAKPESEKADPPKINATGLMLADVGRVMHEGADHHDRDSAHRQVEIEDPAPAVVVGNPAAEGRPKNGCEND